MKTMKTSWFFIACGIGLILFAVLVAHDTPVKGDIKAEHLFILLSVFTGWFFIANGIFLSGLEELVESLKEVQQQKRF